MTSHRAGWIRPLLAGLALSLSLAGCSDRLPSSYVRVTAHLMHGDEPVTLDWVVECRHFQRGGEMRAYVRVSVVPYVYGVATRDGGMVMAVAPYWCGGGEPPKDYLPVFLWGDKAGDFSFLTAYVTEDAFTNPASKLKVLDVTLAHATEAEHDAWKKTGVKNVVPAQHNPFLRNAAGRTDERRVGCRGFERIPVMPEVQALVDAAWPADHPPYWPTPENLVAQVFKTDSIDIQILRQNYFYFAEGFGAFPRVVERDTRHLRIWTSTFYPVDFDFYHKDMTEFNFIGREGKGFKRPLVVHARVDQKNIGMMYCGFSTDLFGAVDTEYNYVFDDGEIHTRRDAIWGYIKEKWSIFKLTGFGMDIERGEDGDE